jgi:hypothetical protein
METVFPNCTDRVGKILYDGPIHLLNTTIVPPGADGTWTVESVDTSFVDHCISVLAHAGQIDFIASHIGHEATAQVASELLRQKIDVDRTPWNGDGLAFALQMNRRPPEGKILTREEMEEIGYSWRVLFRVEKANLTVREHLETLGTL